MQAIAIDDQSVWRRMWWLSANARDAVCCFGFATLPFLSFALSRGYSRI